MHYDLFVTKYDASGTKLWTRQLGTEGVDSAFDVASDGANALYVAGSTTGDLDGQTSAGSWDLFVTKYDASGTKLWTRQLGTPELDEAYSVATDGPDAVYVAGYTTGSLDGQTSAGNRDLFVTKYDASGTKLWTRQVGTAEEDEAYGVATDGPDAVYVAGVTYGSLDGQISAGWSDMFVTKFDASGTKLWTRQLGTPELEEASGVAVLSPDRVYLAGYTSGDFEGLGNAGGADIVTLEIGDCPP